MNFALTKDDNKAELLSICINFMKFPLAIMVVVLHSTLIGKPIERLGIDNIDAIAPLYAPITWFFGNFIGNCAVPIFFIISGFLLFYKVDKYTTGTYAQKMKNRFHTLLVPYLIWNTLYMILFYVIGQKNVILSEVPELYGDNTSISKFLYIAYVRPPVDGPLWFIRNLIVMDLLSPVLYVIIKKTQFYFPLLLLIATQFNMNSFALSFLWFSFGIACAVHKFDFFYFCRHYFRVNLLISLIALFIDYICYYKIEYHIADHFYIFRIMAIIGCCYLICERFPHIMGGVKSLAATTFVIYAYHSVPQQLIIAFGSTILPGTQTGYLCLYVLTIVLTVIGGIVLGYIINKNYYLRKYLTGR